MGTPEFAVGTLTALYEAGHKIVGVFTQPDKPKGRGYELMPPEVKVEAMRLGLDVYQPKTVKTPEALELIKGLDADVAVVVAYGKILPEAVLNAPKYGCINVHASLLPKYHGAAPIQWAVIDGEKESGVTTMQMDAGLDTGDMLLQDKIEIGENMTAGELHDELAKMGASLAVRTLEELEKGTLKPKKQGETTTHYASMLDKSLCAIDWSRPAQKIHDQIRGLSPWPVATAQLEGKVYKIHSSRLSERNVNGEAGTIDTDENGMFVLCGDGKTIEIKTIQAPGGKKMNVVDYLRGHKIEKGSRFD